MSNQTIPMTDALHEYLVRETLREPELFARLRAETARMPNASMQIAPEQGQFMALLTRLIGARRILEIGTFTGYSALWMASALPADGRLFACDMSEEWTRIARRYWDEAGLAPKIELRLGPAAATLEGMLAANEAGRFDLAFIDADKTGYDGYYEQCLRLLRPGGLIVVDNMLWNGRVADMAVQDEDTRAIRLLNRKVRDDARVEMSLAPIGDGLLLAIKR